MAWIASGSVSLSALAACTGDEFSGRAAGGAAGASTGGGSGSGGLAGAAGSGGAAAGGGQAGSSSAGSGGGSGANGCGVPGAALWSKPVGESPEYPVLSGDFVHFTTAGAVERIAMDGTHAILHTAGTDNEGIFVGDERVAWADRTSGDLYVLDLAPNAIPIIVQQQQNIQTVTGIDGTLFWTVENGIRRRTATGPVEAVYNSPRAYALTTHEDMLFWVTLDGEVFKGEPLPGANYTLLGSAPEAEWMSVSIAVDATHVYFTARVDPISSSNEVPPDGIWRVPIAGGPVEQVAASPQAEGIALTEGCVYWGMRHNQGRVLFRPKSLDVPPDSVTGFEYPRGLVVAGERLIVVDSGANRVSAHPFE